MERLDILTPLLAQNEKLELFSAKPGAKFKICNKRDKMSEKPEEKNSRYEKYLKRQEAAKNKESEAKSKLGKVIGWDIKNNEKIYE